MRRISRKRSRAMPVLPRLRRIERRVLKVMGEGVMLISFMVWKRERDSWRRPASA